MKLDEIYEKYIIDRVKGIYFKKGFFKISSSFVDSLIPSCYLRNYEFLYNVDAGDLVIYELDKNNIIEHLFFIKVISR